MYDTISGTNDYTVELVRALQGQQRLTVVTVSNTRLRPTDCACLLPVVPAFDAPQPRWWKAVRMGWAYALLVAACLRAPRRTVLHIQFFRFERFEAWLFSCLQRVGVHLVYSAHNALPHDEAKWHRDFYRRWYERVDVVHVLSSTVLQVIEQNVHATPRRTVQIGHGPYTGLLRRFGAISAATCRRALGVDAERFVILQYGLFKEYKGVDRLAEAVCRLPESMRPLLVLAGGGPSDYLDGVERRIASAGRQDCLQWHRHYVDDRVLCELIQIADLVVFPYVKVSQSGALYLSLTFGKPCLCNDLPGFREILPDDAGFFVDAADVNALSSRLAELMESPRQLDRLGAAVRALNRDTFNWQHISEATWKAYCAAYLAVG